MKKISIVIILAVQVFPLLAQKSRLRIAEEYYNSYQFASATKEYEDILIKDPSNLTAKEKLALCYHKLNNSEKEEWYLEQLCKQEQVDSKYFKAYAEVLAKNGKYDESIIWYRKYAKLNPKDNVQPIVEAYHHIGDFYKYASFYTIQEVNFNSTQADFSPAFYRDGLIFCSARDTKGRTYKWDNTSYIDLYFNHDSFASPVLLSKKINSSLHEGPVTFTRNYDTLYFTRNNSTDEGIIKLKICYAVEKNGEWGKVQDFELNSKHYSIGHPALAPDGTLYFISDMPGGLGGTDLYYTKRENGKWILPVNLGPSINTVGNEMFPFIDEKGDLFFASTGHIGLGGLDIFQASANHDFFSTPKNLGSPINSSKDDFALIIKNNEGYFSSNREGAYSDDNIYSFIIDKTKSLSVVAYDQSNRKLDNFMIGISSNGKSYFSKGVRAVEKVFTHVFDCEGAYEIVASKKGYKDSHFKLTPEALLSAKADDTLKIVLEEVIVEKTIVVDLLSDTHEKLFGGTVTLKNLATGEAKNFEVLKHIPVSFVLIKGNNYEITGARSKYKSRSVLLDPDRIDAIADGTLIPIVLSSADALFDNNAIGQIIEMDIKYDVGKAAIRPDAAKELDRLVQYLNQHPAIKVELGSHSDARGSDEANFKLSQKRAEAAVNYVVAKGIKSTRLIPMGYGEKDLKIKNAVTGEEHQENRRTTIKIVANSID